MSAPKLVLVVELERSVLAYLDVCNESEEQRLLFDLAQRDLLGELIDALRERMEAA